MKPKEITICGLAAVKAQFATDAAAIKRLFFDYATGRKIGMICRALAQGKKIYRCVEPAELEKIGGTIHHGGIVAVIAAPQWPRVGRDEFRAWARERTPLLVLDRIGNAHNLGALARTAAFFGLPRLILPEDTTAAMPGDAAYRIAEGGLAHVQIATVPALAAFLRDLADAGYEVVGAVARGGRLQDGASDTKPVALVLGNEEHGLDPAAAAACTRLVTIPGSGRVESLNVSAAGAVLMWELLVRRPAARPKTGMPKAGRERLL